MLSILGTAKVAVALLVLGVPIIDTFWIIVRRLSQGRSPFSPDRRHIHHRLLDLGLSHRQTVFVIYGLCLSLAILALVLSGVDQLYAFIGVFLAFGLVLFIPTRRSFGRPEELDADATSRATDAGRARNGAFAGRLTAHPSRDWASASPLEQACGVRCGLLRYWWMGTRKYSC